ncbi:MAG: menaquinone biosynthesis protein [Saprospiraceae bacterium]|nr:menaquinone biosynthesis protein [Saprospiraceae bacterium]MCB9342417.1 menaquinone biosynthesis protein [Lewinellaceae bacterium]
MSQLRLSAVSYLNTKPFIYGLFRSNLAGNLDISLDIPSVCAEKLLANEVDLALTPVAVIPTLPQAYLASKYCIGATGKVKTVCIFSEKPLEEIRRIYLDFHSKSSVALTHLLCNHYWKISPELIPAPQGFENQISGDTAALIIGDRTIGLDTQYPYVYDLGEAWNAWTGLPFVFAAWISIKPLNPDLMEHFNKALKIGVGNLPELIKILPNMEKFDMESYFRDNISYTLDDAKWQGLNRFLNYLAGENGYNLYRSI